MLHHEGINRFIAPEDGRLQTVYLAVNAFLLREHLIVIFIADQPCIMADGTQAQVRIVLA